MSGGTIVKRVVLAGVVAGLLGLAPASLGQDWASFQAAFRAFPCADGWSGCIVDGTRMGPDGEALPTDLRVDWFDLQPTPAFSPFVGLSAYTGDSQSAEGVVAKVVKRPPVPPPEPELVERPAPPSVPPPVASAGTGSQRPTPQPPPREPPPRKPPPRDPPPLTQTSAPPAGCAELVPLETPAMTGKLADPQIGCLEGRIARDAKQTDKKHASLILIANAWGKGDRDAWESLVLRHLEEIDRSDPALCYKLALHLERQGPPRAAEVIRWADTSMKNARGRWTGEEYTDKMYSLHRLKSKAASELWYVTDQRHVKNPTPESSEAVEKYRGQAKNFSKEWYQYAKDAGKDTTHPREMCLSAAGTAAFCEDA